ncbi:MAG: hypothetical protein RL024_635 [Actinomycetota bacterium]|jgi:hypothetical protein
MSKLGWFAAGLGLGALAVIQLRDNPKAQLALDEAIAAAKDFSQAVAAGYQEREAELSAPVAKTPAARPAAKKPAAKPVAKKPAAKPAAKRAPAKK